MFRVLPFPLISMVMLLSVLALGTITGQERLPFEEKLLVAVPGDVALAKGPLITLGEPEFPFLAPRGSRAIYIGSKDQKVHVFVGEEAGEAFDEIRWLASTTDGKHVAYAGRLGAMWHVVVNGKKGRKVTEVDGVQVSAKGRAIYKARAGKKWSVVVDRKPGPSFDRIANVTQSPDGKRVAYAGMLEHKWRVVIDGRQGSFFEVVKDGPIFSPDSKHVAYVAAVRRSLLLVIQCVVVGKRLEREYPLVSKVNFLGKGKKVAYVMAKGGRQRAVVGKKEHPRFDWVSTPVMPQRSREIAYGALKGNAVQIVHGKNTIDCGQLIGIGLPMEFTLSPDASSCAFLTATDGDDEQLFVFQNDKKLAQWPHVYPKFWFSPVGNKVGYIAGTQYNSHVVVGSKKSKAFDDIVPELHFSADGKKVAFCARTGQEIWWKVMDIDDD